MVFSSVPRMSEGTGRSRWMAVATVALVVSAGAAIANPVPVLHSAGNGAPVQGGPDDLVVLAGYGFSSSDHVVYQEVAKSGGSGIHPGRIPEEGNSSLGLAQVVRVAEPPYSLTVRLPQELSPHHVYRLWVVNRTNEWSEAITLNDPRPSWISPASVYETADIASMGRRIRIVGRNLNPDGSAIGRVRLAGPMTYSLEIIPQADASPALAKYVAEAILPPHISPGSYEVSLGINGGTWVVVRGQRLQVRPDPVKLPRFSVADARFGACHPNDGQDDTDCLERAIDLAGKSGGGVVTVPAGTWDVQAVRQIALQRNVHLQGENPSSLIMRHGAREPSAARGFIVLTGINSVENLGFSDADLFRSRSESRPMIVLGTGTSMGPVGGVLHVDDVVISGNRFIHVGEAIADSGVPVHRLFVTNNDFAAYDSALELPGNRYNVGVPYEIEDSVVRSNRFFPGSYLDITAKQGTIATGIGGSRRVDFSANTADGTSTRGLQKADDRLGWRAAFFWNMNGNQEDLLVSDNRISCSGDKVGDGEAIAFDGNGDTFAFNGAQAVTRADRVSVSVSAPVARSQNGRTLNLETYYLGFWVQIVDGRGIGQVRRIDSYLIDHKTGLATFKVEPAWDVVPSSTSRIIIGREYWHVYAVANVIDQRSPPCRKSNLSSPSGGVIAMWASSADSAIEGNRQRDTSGILFAQGYSKQQDSCPTCDNSNFIQSGLEIRGNSIDGEYDWMSDCSLSGIAGMFGAAPTPGSPPPLESFGVSIAENRISEADALGGGAIALVAGAPRGPPPGDWPLVQSLTIFRNELRLISGPVPRAPCNRGQRFRIGIRLDGVKNVRDATLYRNECNTVDVPIEDGGLHTTLLCRNGGHGNCECGVTGIPN
jgi:hypothetical protein